MRGMFKRMYEYICQPSNYQLYQEGRKTTVDYVQRLATTDRIVRNEFASFQKRRDDQENEADSLCPLGEKEQAATLARLLRKHSHGSTRIKMIEAGQLNAYASPPVRAIHNRQ
jgi:hypothetical protein